MRPAVAGEEPDVLGFTLAGVEVVPPDEADEETLLVVSATFELAGKTEAMVVRLPCRAPSHP